ncbi:MAG: molybdenum cofactor guanylyltransferase [Lachnospiraceae bacterium]|nr:molybdenum cofactor guanylyltransferase [Lachnospiraceae bacterium]
MKNGILTSDLSAAVLVGLSTRMGSDKARLVLNEQTFIGHLIQELSICREVFISTTLDTDYSEYGVKVFVDENKGIGPLEGIRRSLDNALCDNVFICAVDMPYVSGTMIKYLADSVPSDCDICVFRDTERIHPLCGIYNRNVLPVVQDVIEEGRYRLKELLSRVRTKYVDIEAGGFTKDALININTLEEYRTIRGL